MKRGCREIREELADVAEGRGSAAAIAHTAGCPACTARVATYRAIFAAARLPRESAPAPVVASVLDLVPNVRLTVVARRLSPRLAPAVRRRSSEFQIVVGEGSVSIRLMARPEGDGWHVMGRLPSGEWRIEGVPAEVEEDRFSFHADSLASTGFTLDGAERRIVFPALSELLESDDSGV